MKLRYDSRQCIPNRAEVLTEVVIKILQADEHALPPSSEAAFL